ncbi:MAG: hypothetical protein RIM99_10940 [Cyclobacteriaceae bacterium]
MNRLISCAILFSILNSLSGQITGVFGGDAAASGYQHQSNTTNMWLKYGEITLNGAYNRGTLMIDFFPDESPHADSRQTVIVNLRNSSTGYHSSVSDIVLITHYGANLTIKDLKVIHTSGSGVTNNKFSVWLQMGSSWIAHVPIEIRVAGNVTYATTHQIYGPSITETGTTYDVNSRYGMYGSQFEVDGTIRSKEVKVEASPWPDYVFADNYKLPSLETLEAFIKSEGHLPEVPTAKQVEENGIALGEMNALLLKKIEELTLYTIQQENKIQSHDQKIDNYELIIDNLSQLLTAKIESQNKNIEELTLYVIKMKNENAELKAHQKLMDEKLKKLENE